jgi:hypothetical protein
MDFNSTIDLIIKDLNAASEIIDDLKKYPGVPAIQVELAKSKCKSAGEVIGMLKNKNNIFPGKEEPVKEKPVHEKAVPEKAVPEKPIQEKTVQDKPSISDTILTIEETVESEPVKPRVASAEKKTTTKEPEKKVSEPSMIADKFTPPADLYEERISSKFSEKDLSESLKSKPIKNLADAIGLNDRFLFISEIFDGNKDSYNQAISRLDKAENLQDAMAIIMSYTGENRENEAVLQLLDLVRLKFPANE